MLSLGKTSTSQTKRTPLYVDQQAVEMLEVILPQVFELRQYKTPVKFYTLISQLDDDSSIGELIKQNKVFQPPAFIIKRQTVTPAADYLNPYVAQKYGVRMGITKDRHHIITGFPAKVVYSMDIRLLTDDFYILDHWIRVLAMYCRQEMKLGDVTLDDPVYNFPIRGKFGDSYAYPEVSEHGSFKGYDFTTQLDMSTYIVDAEFVPTIGEVTFDPVVVPSEAYQQYKDDVVNVAGMDPMPDVPSAVWQPVLRWTVNLRDNITDPAGRD